MLLAGSADAESRLAGKSTLNRLELAGETGQEDRYKKVHYDAEAIDRVLVQVFLEAPTQPPQEIVIDLDTTDLPLHGHQEQRFFHGFYYHYCYLPLYIVCGEHLLGVRLRPANERCQHWCARRDRAYRQTDPAELAAGENHSARRFRFLPRVADELV